MTDERTERRALEELVRSPDVWAKWDAARRLMAAKQMQSAATNEDFRNSFRELGRTAISGRPPTRQSRESADDAQRQSDTARRRFSDNLTAAAKKLAKLQISDNHNSATGRRFKIQIAAAVLIQIVAQHAHTSKGGNVATEVLRRDGEAPGRGALGHDHELAPLWRERRGLPRDRVFRKFVTFEKVPDSTFAYASLTHERASDPGPQFQGGGEDVFPGADHCV